ncbi:hypothetical protein N8072_00835 [bacterium]|nr:hypothetical protein [bacterium]MDB4128762.1 hypothetical protein [bacterium]MDC1257205.1 hypothetical protein [bacterium]
MILSDLQENAFAKLQKTLSEVFDVNVNFKASKNKLTLMSESTDTRIQQMRDSGIDQSNKDYQKLLLIKEGLTIAISTAKEETVNNITESADLDQAEVLLAAKQMADDLQKMAENLASMQVEDLMSITNAMKEEVGTAEAEAFNAAAEAAIGSALEAVKTANDQVSNAVLTAQGQPVTDMDTTPDMEAPMGDEMPDMDVDLDMDAEAPVDDFEGTDAADNSFDDTGREMKEDKYLAAVRMIKEAQREGKISKDIVKAAFGKLKD